MNNAAKIVNMITITMLKSCYRVEKLNLHSYECKIQKVQYFSFVNVSMRHSSDFAQKYPIRKLFNDISKTRHIKISHISYTSEFKYKGLIKL